MEFLQILFPVSGIKTYVFIPPLVALVISLFTSMGGVSGAFLLLPFQISILNFTTPSVSSTNFLYNIVAIPSGVYRYIREGRMAWPLAWVITIGTIPGVIIGYYMRILMLPDPREFKLFVGCVLLYIGARLFYELSGRATDRNTKMRELEEKFTQRSNEMKNARKKRIVSGLPENAVVRTVSFSLKRVEYEFWGETFSFSTIWMVLLSFAVGIIGGAYGIGGGAIIAPFCVAIFSLPVYSVAGAALMGTFITSVAGVVFYSLIPVKQGIIASPDWLLGLSFGIGGAVGIYAGARLQKCVPQRIIKLMLGILILYVAIRYILQFFQ